MIWTSIWFSRTWRLLLGIPRDHHPPAEPDVTFLCWSSLFPWWRWYSDVLLMKILWRSQDDGHCSQDKDAFGSVWWWCWHRCRWRWITSLLSASTLYHFYHSTRPPRNLCPLWTVQPCQTFSATFFQTRVPFNSSLVKSGIRGEEQPIYAINFSVQQMQWGP